MPSVTFYGATEEVTGSCYLVRGKKITLLVDCGLFQAEQFAHQKNYEPLPFNSKEINAVLLTHAHLDHTGRLPKLHLAGFSGKVLGTAPTLELTKYLWGDALEIMEIEYQETGRLPLYTKADVKHAEKFFEGVEYGRKVKLSATDWAIFHDAGHILGSAFIELLIDGKRLVFSGDIGNVHPPIIRETEALPDEVDLLTCETTYAGHLHEPPKARYELLRDAAVETINNKGTLLIPAFAVERTQEILYEFNNLVNEGILPAIPIYLDSPLAIKATRVFKNSPKFYNKEDYLLQQADGDMFDFPGLRQTATREKSKKINDTPPPKVIIAGNGMMNGGRIVYHLQRYLPDPKTTVLIIGYQAAGTTGRKILDGAKTVRIFNSPIPVKARIKAIGAFSAHGDQKKLLSWIGTAKSIGLAALVHGEPDGMNIFAEKLKELKIKATIPRHGETINI